MNEWRELKIGCLVNTVYEFKDISDNAFIGAYIDNGYSSGICELKQCLEDGETIYKTTNTFRMKVKYFRDIE